MVAGAETQKGFKVTDLGLIPEGWHLHLILTLIDERYILGHLDGNHGELYPRSHEFKESGVPYIGATDFASGIINFSKCKFLSEERALKFRKGIAKDGDVLFAHNATVGPVSLLRTDLEYIILSTTATYFRCNPEKLSNHYLLYALQSQFFVKQYQSVMAQSTRFQVPITTQRKFFLVLPPIEEQTAIATVLSDTDALIENLEKLIAKKRNIKQGAMQELLTGRRRLAGYSGVWKTIELKDLVNQFIVPMRDKPKRFDGNIPWCRIEDFNGKYLSDSKSNQYVSVDVIKAMNLKILPTETLIVSCSADLGRCAIVKKPLTTNQTFIGLVFNENIASNEFFYYYMTFKAETLNMLSSGTTISYLSREQFEIFKVHVPISKTEQFAIAKALSDMDREIEVLEQKLQKYRMIKQGMMQVLLTGKIRLI